MNNALPLYIKFSKGRSYIFVGYKDGIDIISLIYGIEDMIPTLERVEAVMPKESLDFTYRSRTPIIPSQSKDSYLYYLYKSEEIEEGKHGKS